MSEVETVPAQVTTTETETVTEITRTQVITPAHDQRVTLHIIEHIPSHATRITDPFYHIFNAMKRRAKKLGLLKCWVCGALEDVECHHNIVEFSLAEDYDWSKLAQDHPEFNISDDKSFQEMIEGPDNCLFLCRLHHTGIEGIHNIPVPLWSAIKYLKYGVQVPAELELASQL